MNRALNQKTNQRGREGFVIQFSKVPCYTATDFITFYFYKRVSDQLIILGAKPNDLAV